MGGRRGPKGVRWTVALASSWAILTLVACAGGGGDDEQGAPPSTTASTSDATGASTTASPDPVTVPEVTAGTYTPNPCPEVVEVPPPNEIECGTLTVPEDRNAPEGRTVDLAVATLSAEGEPTGGPVVYLEGGPGGDGLSAAEWMVGHPLLAAHDIVLVSQRGTAPADPSFDCPEVEDLIEAARSTALDASTDAQVGDALAACHARATSTGVDLRFYDTAAAADDIESLRLALGLEPWNLYGVSYGTRLGLEVLRRHPEGVRAAILDSAYPPEVEAYASLIPYAEATFAKIADACAADEACNATYPDLLGSIATLYDELEAEPVDSTFVHPDTGEDVTLRWDGTRLARFLYAGSYRGEIVSSIPALVAAMAAGDFGLANLTYIRAVETLNGSFDLAEGLYQTVECRERAPFTDPETLREVEEGAPAWLREAVLYETDYDNCERWPTEPAPASIREPVVSDLPVLILAGSFDPITPTPWAVQTHEHLPNSYLVEFPELSHAVSYDPCPAEAAAAFLDDPSVDPTPDCHDPDATVEWLIPEPG